MKPNSNFYFLIRFLALSCFLLLLAFRTSDSKSEYILPPNAHSVCAADLDLDGDNDIVVGHKYNSQFGWGGLSILENDGLGYLQAVDSFYVDYGFPFVNTSQFDNNELPDLFSIHITANPYTVYVGVIYNYSAVQFDSVKSFIIYYDEMVDFITSGDVNGDGHRDIVFACSTDKFWGVIYNDGNGNFSEPDYYDTELYPNDLAVGDIDGNGRDDIAIAGSDTELYYSFETGFELFTFTGYEHDVELADMDNDGDTDVATVWGAGVTVYKIYENLGYQNFIEHVIYTFYSGSGGLRVPDLNNDSLNDITLLKNNKYFILYNKGNYSFDEPDSITPNFQGSQTYIWEDIDDNGFKDFIVIRDVGDYIPNLKILFNDGSGNFVVNPIISIETPFTASKIQNIQTFPNPFIHTVNIEFYSTINCDAELSVYDQSGYYIQKIFHEKISIENQKLIWNGTDQDGKEVKPGTYYACLKADGKILQTVKLIKY
ncbi:MAG: VCBS repeat-containing protein [Bacteroidetes bacterium]|nr:VCBS repeat-containing protein [Bacteroidota bacterium]